MPPSIRSTATCLLLIQGGNYLFPLVLLPFLGHKLGVREFGVLAYCQALAQYLILLTDYGHNLSATRLVSLRRDDPAAVAAVFSATMAAKLLLTTAAALLFGGALWWAPELREHRAILGAAFVGVVANAVTPIWLYQGLERMKVLVLPNFASKAVSLACVVTWVRSPGDAALAALGISVGTAILAIVALWGVWRGRLAALVRVPAAAAIASLRDGFPMFLSLVLVSFYVNFNAILLNHFHGPVAVGQFSMADKIRIAGQTIFTVVGTAFYPRISQYHIADPSAARALMRRAMVVVFALSGAMFVAIELFAGVGVRMWLGEPFHDTILLLRMEAVLLPLTSVAFIFGNLGLMASGRHRAVRNIYAAVTVMHLLYAVPFVMYMGARGTVISVLITEAAGAIAFYFCYRREIAAGVPAPAPARAPVAEESPTTKEMQA
ncbi:oligosaccharide flippase family protein [Cupriavidus sp.]|uniref:oligosaccharide flippase family protein n=1 Tax=Cupriavidus sp. TaxID=1873897 RepID=UPI0025BA38C8|nr:oligosaccharide flippase family protein [Cupriavidus sp.]MCA3182478.1 oligosaccharide flippase family protein [Cupriavidus sp.]MCA3193766.1 oligosaccharide flippase family protein [Cupriavidus sp.]MCA3196261.1 oligosaccharide flippase family protein [Cupriavidus sp.]MCA3203782.1 oligosaccharide flippase family protein [Cupriavidus sp.]MCA3207826.1 oligosaccharide flippase family protein [Cupriavidus sp.]